MARNGGNGQIVESHLHNLKNKSWSCFFFGGDVSSRKDDIHNKCYALDISRSTYMFSISKSDLPTIFLCTRRTGLFLFSIQQYHTVDHQFHKSLKI